jgi:hypothetical protein
MSRSIARSVPFGCRQHASLQWSHTFRTRSRSACESRPDEPRPVESELEQRRWRSARPERLAQHSNTGIESRRAPRSGPASIRRFACLAISRAAPSKAPAMPNTRTVPLPTLVTTARTFARIARGSRLQVSSICKRGTLFARRKRTRWRWAGHASNGLVGARREWRSWPRLWLCPSYLRSRSSRSRTLVATAGAAIRSTHSPTMLHRKRRGR